jgi:hypothetical protein
MRVSGFTTADETSENVHLQPYETEQDFYEQNYPKYLALLDRAAAFLKDTKAKPEKTVVFVRQVSGEAGFIY